MVGPLEMESGCLTENDSEVAETLNTFFKSVFVDEDTSHIPEFQLHTDVVPTEMVDIDITIQEVLIELKKLDSNKAAGPDGLPSMVLKACADVLALPLLILFKSHWTLVSFRESGNRPLSLQYSKKEAKPSLETTGPSA